MKTLCDCALSVLETENAKEKARKTREYAALWRSSPLPVGFTDQTPLRPARPEKPELKHASQMPKRRKAGTRASKIALLHAIAHIELNAIDLAWDIMARFSYLSDEHTHKNKTEITLPRDFFADWLKVADDEAKHFLMLESRLNDFDATYGDLPAHDGLWEASERTAEDFAARLAIVPMVLEARGLDVTPAMIKGMKTQNDQKTADMLQIIHDDEITHVRAGTVWFEYWCNHHNKDIEMHWQELVKTYFNGKLKRPFNHPSREEAGMIRDWYEPLADIDFNISES